MSNFMKAFDEQRDSYLAHYGVKGMQWGVRNEEEPVGQQPAYSEQDAQSMKQTADKVRNADADSVKEKRKRIVKNIVKGVAIGAIVAGITVGAVKGYAKKQTGEEQDLATSLGIIGQKISKKPGQIGDAVKKGFNMNTEEVLKNNQKAAQEKRDAAKAKISDMLKKRGFKNIYNSKGYVETENSREMTETAVETETTETVVTTETVAATETTETVEMTEITEMTETIAVTVREEINRLHLLLQRKWRASHQEEMTARRSTTTTRVKINLTNSRGNHWKSRPVRNTTNQSRQWLNRK